MTDLLAKALNIPPLKDHKAIAQKPNISASDQSLVANPKKDVAVSVAAEESSANLANDYQFVRLNLYDILTKGGKSLEELSEIASQSQHPRSYEAMALLIKNLGDTADKIMQLHKDVKEITETQPQQVNHNLQVANAVFVGSTSELLERINDNGE
jgi:hypothetical protein